MALMELIAICEKEIKQRKQERELLENIAEIAGYETAEAAADRYAAAKHAYTCDGYLYQLEKLRKILAAGAPPGKTMKIVDECHDGLINEIFKMYQKEDQQ